MRTKAASFSGLASGCEMHADKDVVHASLMLIEMSEPTSKSAPSYAETFNAYAATVRVMKCPTHFSHTTDRTSVYIIRSGHNEYLYMRELNRHNVGSPPSLVVAHSHTQGAINEIRTKKVVSDAVKGSFAHLSKGEDPLADYAFVMTVKGIVNEYDLPYDKGTCSACCALLL